MTPQEMWLRCFTRECDIKEMNAEVHFYKTRKLTDMPPRLFGFAETTAPLSLFKWNGQPPYEKNVTEVVLPVGTTVKALMFSRFGDFGITDDLNAEHGYHRRLFPTRDQSVSGNPFTEIPPGALTAEDCLTNFRVWADGPEEK
jgi:hypothetical protein